MVTNEQEFLSAYKQTRPLIGSIVNRVKHAYGGDYHELMADADEHFWRAYTSYDPTRGADLKTWVYWQVWGRLRSEQRQNRTHNAPQNEQLQGDEREEQHFHLNQFLEQLSPEAQLVVLITIDLPVPVVQVKETKGAGRYENKRSAIRTYLQGCGWSQQQINESFAEVAQVLTDAR